MRFTDGGQTWDQRPVIWTPAHRSGPGRAAIGARARHVEHDSATFTNALDRWFPLVYAKTSTPRAIKRFLNRVRFYAMSQRGAASPAPDRPTQIPEDALVALSVMQHAGVGTVDEALGHIALEVDPM